MSISAAYPFPIEQPSASTSLYQSLCNFYVLSVYLMKILQTLQVLWNSFLCKTPSGADIEEPDTFTRFALFCSNRGSFIFWNSDTVVGYDAGASPLEMVNGMKLFVFFALGVSGDCGSAVLLFSLSHHAISLLSFPCPHDQSVLPVSRLQTLWNNDYRAKRNLGPLWPEAQVQKEERWLISAHF